MNSLYFTNSSRAYTLCTVVVAIGVLSLLLLLGFQGAAVVKERCELTVVASQVGHLSTALQLYYQRYHRFPDAYPADLERDLGPYVEDPEIFVSRAHPEAGATPLNRSYVAPVAGSENRYVLSLDPAHYRTRSVVLFADAVVEMVEELPVYHDGVAVESGTIVTGGILRFTSGAAIGLSEGTSATIVKSFKDNSGALLHIVKHDKGQSGSVEGLAPDDAIVELASEAALVFLRGGRASATLSTVDGQGRVEALAASGEVIVDGRIIGREQSSDPGGTLLGDINLNPGGGGDGFHFVLEKPDGTTITRDDLLASKGDLEYSGPVARLQFQGKNSSEQNTLTLNGEVFPLEGGETYTITAADMTVHLYNDNPSGRAMGRWHLDDLQATGAHIAVTGSEADPDSHVDAESAVGDVFFDEQYRVDSGSGWRALGRGTVLKQDERITATKYR